VDKEWLRELVEEHRYRILGALIGLVVALLIIRFGILWALFILLCVGIGYWVGKQLDEDPERLFHIFDRLLPPGGR